MDQATTRRQEPRESDVITTEEMLRFLSFVDQIDMEADTRLQLSSPNALYRMSMFLLRQHLEAKLVTVTALAAASGVPYATAMRRIDEMLEQGLVDPPAEGQAAQDLLAVTPAPR